MKKIVLISANTVVKINKAICNEYGINYVCYGEGKVESALHSAFYPGTYPFHHGGIAGIAGAIAFYITQAHAFFDGNKRTAVISSLTFLGLNGSNLSYSKTPDALAHIIEKCADGKASKEEVINWFENHKV